MQNQFLTFVVRSILFIWLVSEWKLSIFLKLYFINKLWFVLVVLFVKLITLYLERIKGILKDVFGEMKSIPS